jgi:type I restriction enzyme, S subunit
MNNYQLSINNYQLPKGYKQTEVGVIPEDWEVRTIGETVTLINGRAFKPSDWSTYGVPIIRIQNLNDPMGAYNYYEGAVEERYYVNYGDILFAWSGTKESSFGARMWHGQKAILNQHIFRVAPNEEKITAQYILLALKKFQEEIEKKSHGFKSSFVHIRKSDLENTYLTIPPLPEQRAIAATLSDVDALITALDKLIAKQRHLKTATMQQLLTGKKRLPGFGEGKNYKQTEVGLIPEDWEEVGLPDLAWFQEGPGVRNYQFTQAGIKLLNGTNISNGKITLNTTNRHISENEAFGSYKHFLVDAGDILIASSGITIDKFHEKVAFAQSEHLPLCMNTSTIRFKIYSDKITDQYLYFFLQSDSFKDQIGKQATGSAQLNFGPAHLKKVNLAISSNLEEQRAIATVLSDMDAAISALETRRAKTQAIKQGMMQELLTGRTRLV